MIYAVISKKGGVGKTTTSVNLAAALALRGQRVLVVDLDPNAGASLSLGLEKSELAPGAVDILLRDLPAREAIRSTAVGTLSLLPASVDLRFAEVEMAHLNNKNTLLAERIAPVAEEFDHIFLDCPSSMGILSQNAVVAADAFMVPAMPHFLALEGLDHLIASAERLSLGAGRRIHFLGIVLTVVDYRISTTRMSLARIRRQFGSRVFAVEIRTNVSLAEAPAYGQTVFQYRPASTGARSYDLLAEELLLLRLPGLEEPAELAALAS